MGVGCPGGEIGRAFQAERAGGWVASGAFEELEIQCAAEEQRWMKSKGGGR